MIKFLADVNIESGAHANMEFAFFFKKPYNHL